MKSSIARYFQLILFITMLAPAFASNAVETPYGPVTLPFKLHQVPGKPVYYVIGYSAVPGSDNQGHTSNAGFVVTKQGVVVFDALGTPALGYRLLQRIREVTDQPVKYIVVSHYHADHIYGLQAFKEHAGNPVVIAQQQTLGYIGGTAASQGEAGQRRLEQRRKALFPWVDEDTYLVPPDVTFKSSKHFKLGGLDFELTHMGPAHAPGDSIMYIKQLGVLFSGDVIYKGRVPFLDSPQTDTKHWLTQLHKLATMKPAPSFIIPGHGTANTDVHKAIAFTQEYIRYIRQQMKKAVDNFVQFDEAYKNTDWSAYKDMPAFKASNRGNAYRIYLELESQSF